MLVLFETAAGYAVFKVLDESKLEDKESLPLHFKTASKASKLLELAHFEKFKDTTEALESATALIEGKVGKKLKKLLKKVVGKGDLSEQLAVADPKLATSIKEKLNISCNATSAVQELMSCIRSQVENLIPEFSVDDERAMQLGLSHGIGRYKLKFSPDKVDTMIIQAVSLLDDLDKELNNYIMRCREWYGWHFPELFKIVPDNLLYVKSIKRMGMKQNAAETDFSDLLPEDVEAKLKETAEVSMGTDIAEDDMLNINQLCDNIIELHEYREQLYEYLKNRMMAIAPNCTILFGEMVGARLISKAGSLLNLAKHPASTVQILGAEKALFRALKTKKDTPKYGLIYHAQLVGQTSTRIKGKMARMLAAKGALASRVDALGEDIDNQLGIQHRGALEAKLQFLEEGGLRKISNSGKKPAKYAKQENKSFLVEGYKPAADSTLGKRKFEETAQQEVKDEEEEGEEEVEEGAPALFSSQTPKKKKKDKTKLKQEQEDGVEEPEVLTSGSEGKKDKKRKKRGSEGFSGEASAATTSGHEEQAIAEDAEAETVTKKKKKKKSKGGQDAE